MSCDIDERSINRAITRAITRTRACDGVDGVDGVDRGSNAWSTWSTDRLTWSTDRLTDVTDRPTVEGASGDRTTEDVDDGLVESMTQGTSVRETQAADVDRETRRQCRAHRLTTVVVSW